MPHVAQRIPALARQPPREGIRQTATADGRRRRRESCEPRECPSRSDAAEERTIRARLASQRSPLKPAAAVVWQHRRRTAATQAIEGEYTN
jgi:hypothetical protein